MEQPENYLLQIMEDRLHDWDTYDSDQSGFFFDPLDWVVRYYEEFCDRLESGNFDDSRT
jgi:hypothetical protein